MNYIDMFNLAEDIEQFMYECGEYNRIKAKIQWINGNKDRDETTDNIYYDLCHNFSALTKYLEHAVKTSKIKSRKHFYANKLLKQIQSI